MAGHAGFAVATPVGESGHQSVHLRRDHRLLATQRVAAVHHPRSVPLVGGGTARLSGIGLFEQRPQVKLVANPANAVSMTASAILFVTDTTNSSLPFTLISETWKVRLSGDRSGGHRPGRRAGRPVGPLDSWRLVDWQLVRRRPERAAAFAVAAGCPQLAACPLCAEPGAAAAAAHPVTPKLIDRTL